MMIFGKSLSQYLAFSRLFLILVPLVGIVRLILSLQGVPNSTVQWVSMTAAGLIGVVYFAIRIHTSGFGSYKQLLVVVALQNLASQAVSILGIVTSIVSGKNNIYSSPEFAFGSPGNTWTHVAAHLFIGTTVGSLVPWLIGSLILVVIRTLSGARPAERSRI
jgi:hypothetical protein